MSIRRRTALFTLTALSALAFGWAALVLPWHPSAPLALVAACLSALHAITAAAALFRPPAALRAWRVLAFASLGAAPIFLAAIGMTAVQMVYMYGALGWGLTALLAVIGWLLLVGTLPVALWGLRSSGRAHERS